MRWPRGRARASCIDSGATLMTRATGSSRGHQASPAAPKQRTGKLGQRCRPKRTGRSVKRSRALPPPGTVTQRVAGSGSNPTGVTGAYSTLRARLRAL